MKTWTAQRINQLKDLQQLLVEVNTLDHGSGFIHRLQRCIAISEKLTKLDLSKPESSFIQFLVELCIKERAK